MSSRRLVSGATKCMGSCDLRACRRSQGVAPGLLRAVIEEVLECPPMALVVPGPFGTSAP